MLAVQAECLAESEEPRARQVAFEAEGLRGSATGHEERVRAERQRRSSLRKLPGLEKL